MTGRTSANLKKALRLLSKYSVYEAARKADVHPSTIYRHLQKEAAKKAKEPS